MFDYIRVASAVPKVSVGNTDFNTEEIIKKYTQADREGADIVVFPELCITGYTCGDLFFQSALWNGVKKSVAKICEVSKNLDSIAVVGAPVTADNRPYNCAITIYKGEIYGIIPKTMIPNYGEFYEKRWFVPGENMPGTSMSSSVFGFEEEYNIPFAPKPVFAMIDGTGFSVEICEDLWSPIPPSCFSALDGAELIVNLSASNETISKREYRRSLVEQQSARLIAGYVYTSAGTGESSTDLIFSGHSLIAENGSVICESEHKTADDYLMLADLDLGKIRADRRRNTTFIDSANLYKPYCHTINIPHTCRSDGSLAKISKLPFVPQAHSDRMKRCSDIFEMQSAALCKRMSVAGNRLVVGVSGGLDSTLALLVCAAAEKRIGKPVSEVTGITMPCFGTTDRTYNNSLKLMKTLGVTQKEISIREACSLHFRDIGQNPDNYDVTYENCQARERTQVLMDYAGKIGGFVVGTGDLSELALGWCTYNADHMSMYGVNSGIPKTLVRWMIESVADADIFPESTEVLRDIIDTPISPELLPPDASGKISQQTEDIVGPYSLHDFFLYYTVRFGFSPSKTYALAKRAFGNDFPDEIILKWLKVFFKRFFAQQFKRSCLPDGVKIGSICLSPRGDWRMPSDASAAVWLDEIEKLH